MVGVRCLDSPFVRDERARRDLPLPWHVNPSQKISRAAVSREPEREFEL